MCTSIVVNKGKTIVGWNLDLLDMQYRINPNKNGVYIEINDATEGWMPLFGANSRGEFVGMPTCWPADQRSDPKDDSTNIISLDVDLLLQKKTFEETYNIVKTKPICSIKGLTFMGSLSDAGGNVLHIVPGQGYNYYERPDYQILTNFSPFKDNCEVHPWMGRDRYLKAEELLKQMGNTFDVQDCFKVLKAVAQSVCPTVVSMVFDVTDRIVYWCEKQNWQNIQKYQL